MTPKILHIDMNKFYASVEQMLNPQLKNKPIAVCGSTEERHGIVLTASAEAKARGVKTGMANWEARRACPGLIVVPPQYDQYCKYSKLARAIYGRYSDRIEPFGMDECWVDISPIGSLHAKHLEQTLLNARVIVLQSKVEHLARMDVILPEGRACSDVIAELRHEERFANLGRTDEQVRSRVEKILDNHRLRRIGCVIQICH